MEPTEQTRTNEKDMSQYYERNYLIIIHALIIRFRTRRKLRKRFAVLSSRQINEVFMIELLFY
jgi:hypothetical protein